MGVSETLAPYQITIPAIFKQNRVNRFTDPMQEFNDR